MAQLVEQEKPASPQLAHYVAEYRRSIADGRQQPQWLTQARQSAIAKFERLGFPTTRLEQWRFTSVAPIAERTFTLSRDGADAAGLNMQALSTPAAHAVCVNGRFVPTLSSAGTLPQGVRVSGLEEALATDAALLEPYLEKLTLTQTNAFTSQKGAVQRCEGVRLGQRQLLEIGLQQGSVGCERLHIAEQRLSARRHRRDDSQGHDR